MNDVTTALAVARLRAWRLGLLRLHKAVLDAERTRYERVHGRIENPHEVLRLVLNDPWFEWLKPIAALIMQMDERLAEEAPVSRDEVSAFRDALQRLLRSDTGTDARFRDEYRRMLQDHPEVVVMHGELAALLTETH
jgi:hypothetical protein